MPPVHSIRCYCIVLTRHCPSIHWRHEKGPLKPVSLQTMGYSCLVSILSKPQPEGPSNYSYSRHSYDYLLHIIFSLSTSQRGCKSEWRREAVHLLLHRTPSRVGLKRLKPHLLDLACLQRSGLTNTRRSRHKTPALTICPEFKFKQHAMERLWLIVKNTRLFRLGRMPR